MMRTTVTPQFVELIPKDLAEGVLYISNKYATATHRCLCGCGTKIVTPLKPGFWKLTVREGLVSLHPSVGNWNHPCQSHYVIARNGVRWVGGMSKAQIDWGRARDHAWVAHHYGNDHGGAQERTPSAGSATGQGREAAPQSAAAPNGTGGFWAAIWRWLVSR